jgi:hypothetical protein
MESLERIINELKAHVSRESGRRVEQMLTLHRLDGRSRAIPKACLEEDCAGLRSRSVQHANSIASLILLITRVHSHFEAYGSRNPAEERQEQDVQDKKELCAGSQSDLDELLDV